MNPRETGSQAQLVYITCKNSTDHGVQHPGYRLLTESALSEIGIQHTGCSKPADEFLDVDFDLVVTVCDAAAEECPVWLGEGRRVHHSFPDPAKAEGTDDEVMAVFRKVRDDIEREMIRLLKTSEVSAPTGCFAKTSEV